jgi:hypothetical protein
MKRLATGWLCVLFLVGLSAADSYAVLTLAKNAVAPLANGKNVLAAACFNDSPGSSDMTLIVRLRIDGKTVVDEGSACKVIAPKQNYPNDKEPAGWVKPAFDDAKWQDGKYGVGYGDNDDNTVIGDGQQATIYTRAIFEVKDASAVKTVELGADFDDATVIWINGVEVARESGTGLPEFPAWDSWCDNGTGHSHEASKQDPPRYDVLTMPAKAIASPFAVEPAGKLALTWGGLKAGD